MICPSGEYLGERLYPPVNKVRTSVPLPLIAQMSLMGVDSGYASKRTRSVRASPALDAAPSPNRVKTAIPTPQLLRFMTFSHVNRFPVFTDARASARHRVTSESHTSSRRYDPPRDLLRQVTLLSVSQYALGRADRERTLTSGRARTCAAVSQVTALARRFALLIDLLRLRPGH